MSEPTRSIIIQLKGDVTYATMLSGYDGELVARHACARRNPKDEYNRYEGARIALARVLGVDPFPETEIENVENKVVITPIKPKKDPYFFEVGDQVRTRKCPFVSFCRNRPAVVTYVRADSNSLHLTVLVQTEHCGKHEQICTVYRNGADYEAPIEHWDEETMGKHPFTNKKEARKK